MGEFARAFATLREQAQRRADAASQAALIVNDGGVANVPGISAEEAVDTQRLSAIMTEGREAEDPFRTATEKVEPTGSLPSGSDTSFSAPKEARNID